MLVKHVSQQNHLLAALPEHEWLELSEYLELVWLPTGATLCHAGEKLAHVYFPITAIVSLHYMTAAGATLETASIGSEGVVGVSVFMGDGDSHSSALVQSAGQAWRLHGNVLKNEFQRDSVLRLILLRYVQALLAQITLGGACSCHHSVEQRLSRWLLCTLDRSSSTELVVTQEFMANILGVRREGITVATGCLQRAGMLITRRGRITILDRDALQRMACSCYAELCKERSSLLRDVSLLGLSRGRAWRAGTSASALPTVRLKDESCSTRIPQIC